MTHEHKMYTMDYRPFSGPVAREENPAAHGAVCIVEKCACGYQRLANVNRRQREQGPWVPSAELRQAQAEREARKLDAEARRRRLAGGGVTWRSPDGDMSLTVQVVTDTNVSLVRRSKVASTKHMSISWRELRAAAEQEDADLASAYTEVLRDAEALRPGATR